MQQYDPAFVHSMKAMSRAHLAQIWKKGQKGEPLAGEDQLYYQCMLEHPELFDVWENIEQLLDRDVRVHGASPFLHLSLHVVVESQYLSGNPPEVRDAITRLVRKGCDRHEAVHRVGSVLARMMWKMLESESAFPMEEYRQELKCLR
jgi:hypothetical protein